MVVEWAGVLVPVFLSSKMQDRENIQGPIRRVLRLHNQGSVGGVERALAAERPQLVGQEPARNKTLRAQFDCPFKPTAVSLCLIPQQDFIKEF